MDRAKRRQWKRNSQVCVFSTSKGLTNLVVAQYVSAGLLQYEQPVARYWPEFAQSGKGDITVSQLLSHQAGLHGKFAPTAAGDDHLTQLLLEEDGEQLGAYLAQTTPYYLPAEDGSRHGYHTITVGWYVDQLLRKVGGGRKLQEVLAQDFAGDGVALHLGLPSLDSNLKKLLIADLVGNNGTLGVSKKLAKQMKQIEDEAARKGSHTFCSMHPFGLLLRDRAMEKITAPSANFYSNASSIVHMLDQFQPKELGGGGLLSPAVIRTMAEECTHGPDLVLGIQEDLRWTKGGFFSNHTNRVDMPTVDNLVFHPGAKGSFMWLDTTNGVSISYTPNLGVDAISDPRGDSLVSAVYRSLGLTSAPYVPMATPLGASVGVAPGTKAPMSLDSEPVVEEKSPPPDLGAWKASFLGDGSSHITVPAYKRGASPLTEAGAQIIHVGDLLRTLTRLGPMKTQLPMLAVYLRLGTLRMIQRGLRLFSAYKAKVDARYKFSELQLIEERLTHKYFLDTMSGLGYPLTITKPVPVVQELESLISFLEYQYSDRLDAAHTLIESGKADLNAYVELYRAGELVEGTAFGLSGHPVGYRVCDSYFEVEKSMFITSFSFHLVLQCVASLGDAFTSVEFEQVITTHDVDKSYAIAQLEFRPLSTEAQANLAKVGERYSQFAVGHHYVEYGPNSFAPHQKEKQTFLGGAVGSNAPEGGRVMLDTERGYDEKHSAMSADSAGHAISNAYLAYKNQKARKGHGQDATSATFTFARIPPTFHCVAWPAVVGFSFTLKRWGHVLVGSVNEVQYNTDSFQRLVIPPQRKELLEAIVTQHASTTFSSVIAGKGEGAIFLLHGPPGTGKTLTCEATSELLHRPLYSVSMGELGITPAELEQNLQRILTLCSAWDALVLLDDADIYVERRGEGNILRNSMVGVILRLTEYYRGVLFFTTNRVTSFDPAFRSRVTLALRYRALSGTGRETIWENVLLASGGVSPEALPSFDFHKLAVTPLNGRQITSAVQLALALSKHRGNQCITQAEVASAVEMLLDFDEDEEALAQMEQDDF
eukprot:TRINITY_DN1323_c0_g1_i2.p1 TRINITY_DN1323_c0_g1~~TRINITY_DN1323_c0_g1_i2.p1  ORF type:complete len:1113 (-),score=151.08 TRINITY_DN1323_c0_g1_i2:37-3177(-)